MIRTCSCENEYQDKLYGRYKRVKNPTKSGGAKCTVCGKEEKLSNSEIKELKQDSESGKKKK